MDEQGPSKQLPKSPVEKLESIQRQKLKLSERESKLLTDAQTVLTKANPPQQPPPEEKPVTPTDVDPSGVTQTDTGFHVSAEAPAPPPMTMFEKGQLAKAQVATAKTQAARRPNDVQAHFLAGKAGTQFLSGDHTKNKK